MDWLILNKNFRVWLITNTLSFLFYAKNALSFLGGLSKQGSSACTPKPALCIRWRHFSEPGTQVQHRVVAIQGHLGSLRQMALKGWLQADQQKKGAYRKSSEPNCNVGGIQFSSNANYSPLADPLLLLQFCRAGKDKDSIVNCSH